jgi:hypothetical protein
MSKKSESNQGMKYSKGELLQLSDKYINLSERDYPDLKDVGFKKEITSETKKSRKAYSIFPTHQEIVADQGAVTEKKEIVAKKLKVAITEVTKRIDLRFGDDSPVMKKAGGKSVSLKDAALCEKGGRVERVGREYLEELKENGLTEEMLTNLKECTDTFDDLIDEQKRAIVNSELKTQERHKLANELYEYIVKISDFGKATYEGVDEAKYNDYIIGDKAKKKKTANDTGETDDGAEG